MIAENITKKIPKSEIDKDAVEIKAMFDALKQKITSIKKKHGEALLIGIDYDKKGELKMNILGDLSLIDYSL